MPAYPSSPKPRRVEREAVVDAAIRTEFESGHEEARARWHKERTRFELLYQEDAAGRDAIFDFLKARRLGVERFDYTPHYPGSATYQVRYVGEELPMARIVEGPGGELYEFTVALFEAF